MLDRSATLPDRGERKQATILFADIVASTHLIASLDAEDGMRRLQPVLTAMTQSVRRFDGWILRTLGDGLLAAFGAPRAQEGHALLACKAALAMQEAVHLNSEPQIRIGLHSGEVIATEFDIGSMVEQHTSGITVHIANRIEQLAEPGTICASEACIELIRAYCDTLPMGPRSIRGCPQPVQIHRLLGLKPAVASEQFRGSELTPLCGREGELTLLRRALDEAEKGIASVIGISSPPGLGKSRLCYEFGEWCRRRHLDVLEARGLVFGQSTPLQPLLEMLRSYFRVSPLDEPTEARRKIAESLRALDPGLDDDTSLLCEFLGIGGAGTLLESMSPRFRHARLRTMFKKLVRSVGLRVVVIVFEDLHWLDEASAEFIETLVDAIEGTRIVLVLNFRPPYHARWMNRYYYRELSLVELAPSHMRQLLRDLVSHDLEVENICMHVVERSSGNPFFAEELVRSLVERGVLVGNRGSYRLGETEMGVGLPATLEAVIGARLDRLANNEKLLLQIGATIGKEFPQVLLERVATISTEQLRHSLDRLRDAGLIQECSTIAGRGLAFRHPLIQEVAYSMQLRARRARLHAEVAAAIEGFEWGQLDEFASLLAYHFEASRQPQKAAMHLQRAARWVGRTNSAEAIKNWKRIRYLLNDEPHTETADRLRALASGQILSSGWREGMLADEAKPYAEEALRYARAVGDEMYEPMLLGSYGRILGASGAADDYVALAREGLALTEQAQDAGRSVALGGMLCQAYWLAGLLKQALATNDSALAAIAKHRNLEAHITLGLSVRQLLGFDVEHWIKCLRTRILAGLGRFREASDWANDLLSSASGRTDPPVTLFIPHVVLVEIGWWQDDPDLARENAARVNEYSEQTAIPYLRVAALGCSGLAKSAAKDFTGAIRFLNDAIELAHVVKAGLEFVPRLFADLADTQYRAGDVETAAQTAAHGMELARRRTQRVAECRAAITRVAALNALGVGTEETRHLLEEIERLIAESGAEILPRN